MDYLCMNSGESLTTSAAGVVLMDYLCTSRHNTTWNAICWEKQALHCFSALVCQDACVIPGHVAAEGDINT